MDAVHALRPPVRLEWRDGVESLLKDPHYRAIRARGKKRSFWVKWRDSLLKAKAILLIQVAGIILGVCLDNVFLILLAGAGLSIELLDSCHQFRKRG